MFNHPILPAILLGFSAIRLFTGTATWWTAVSAIAAGLWLADSWKKWQAARDAAESRPAEDALQSPSASPPATPSAERPAITPEQIQTLRAMLDTNADWRKGRLPEHLLSEEEIRATAKPAILLHRLTLPVPFDHPARSYFGGLPRLPAEMAWPEVEWSETFAMTFLAQIDLAELPAVEGSPLPREGTLYFFTDMNHDSPETDVCRVLYYAGDASAVMLRDLPENARAYGFGEEAWPWLPETSVWAKTSFRFPIEFTMFDSVRDYVAVEGPTLGPPTRNREVSERLMAAEFARRFDARIAPSKDSWMLLEADSDHLPFAWAAIEHAARFIALSSRKSGERREAAGSRPELERISASATAWVDRAAQMPPQSQPDAETRAAFLKEWRVLDTELQTVCRASGIYPDLNRLRSHIITAACYVCASLGAADVIPENYRAVLEQMNDPGMHFPRHQMLGHGETVQSAPVQYAQGVLLLQLLGDSALGWHTNGGCAYQFWGDPDAVRKADFDSVEMTLECD